MQKIRDALHCLLEHKTSIREAARRVGLSRRAVSDCLKRFFASGLIWPLPSDIDEEKLEQALYVSADRLPKKSKEQIDFREIHSELKQKGATLMVLHDEWLQKTREENHISYEHFCRLFRQFKKSLRISLRQSYVYGELALVDYAGPTIPITNIETGELRTAQIFIGILGGSNYTFCEATWSQKSRDWIDSHIRMFDFFGGVPRVIVHDNLRSAVTRADRLSPIINESYLNLCRHYGTHPFAARAYRPQDKAKAEAAVLLVERWILFRLRKRKFFSLSELNDAIRELLSKLNHKPFQKLNGCRFSQWNDLEKSVLMPICVDRYEYAECGLVRAGIDYYVIIEKQAYSVPNHLRGQELKYRLTSTELNLYHKGRGIATHTRCFEPGKLTTNKQHLTPAHNAVVGWSAEESLDWAREIGPSTVALMTIQLKRLNNHLFGYRTTQALKKLEKQHGKVRLEEACKYANANKVTKTSDISRILTNNLDRLSPSLANFEKSDEDINLDRQDHENIRGANYYLQVLKQEDGNANE